MLKFNFLKIFGKFRYFLLLFVFGGMVYEIFFFSKTSDFVTFGLLLGWILTVNLFKFKAKASFVGALGFLFLAQFLTLFRVDLTPPTTEVEKAVLWAYFFLFFGAAHQTIDLYKNK